MDELEDGMMEVVLVFQTPASFHESQLNHNCCCCFVFITGMDSYGSEVGAEL